MTHLCRLGNRIEKFTLQSAITVESKLSASLRNNIGVQAIPTIADERRFILRKRLFGHKTIRVGNDRVGLILFDSRKRKPDLWFHATFIHVTSSRNVQFSIRFNAVFHNSRLPVRSS